MTALNFPNSPVLAETYSKYKWDGEKWVPGHTNVVIPPSTLFLARTSGLDATHINAYTALIDGLVTDGVWDQLDILYIFATTSSTNALLNLVSTSYNGTATGGPSFTADRGFSSGWINTNFNPTTAVSPKYTQNAAHISVWLVNDNNGPGAGAASAGGGNVPWQMIMPGPTMYARVNVDGGAVGGGQGFNTGLAFGWGHFIAVRNNSTDVRGFRSGTAIAAAITGQTSTILNLNMYVVGVNNNGTGAAASQEQTAASFGGVLDTTQTLALYTRIKTYMLTVGAPTEEVSQFFARTGIIGSAPLEAAYSRLITGLVLDGVWAKLDALYIFAAQDTTRANLNLVSSSYPITPNGSPTFTQYRGYAGVDGSAAVFLQTNFNPATASSPKFVRDSAHMSAWCVTNITGNSFAGVLMGHQTSAAQQADIFGRFSDGNAYYRMNGSGAGSVVSASPTGHHIANRSASNAVQGYKDGVSVMTNSDTSTAVSNFTVLVLAQNNGGPAATGTSNQIAAASIGSSLTPTEAANFYARLRTFLTFVGVP